MAVWRGGLGRVEVWGGGLSHFLLLRLERRAFCSPLDVVGTNSYRLSAGAGGWENEGCRILLLRTFGWCLFI